VAACQLVKRSLLKVACVEAEVEWMELKLKPKL